MTCDLLNDRTTLWLVCMYCTVLICLDELYIYSIYDVCIYSTTMYKFEVAKN
jgi:hypothetical protein